MPVCRDAPPRAGGRHRRVRRRVPGGTHALGLVTPGELALVFAELGVVFLPRREPHHRRRLRGRCHCEARREGGSSDQLREFVPYRAVVTLMSLVIATAYVGAELPDLIA